MRVSQRSQSGLCVCGTRRRTSGCWCSCGAQRAWKEGHPEEAKVQQIGRFSYAHQRRSKTRVTSRAASPARTSATASALTDISCTFCLASHWLSLAPGLCSEFLSLQERAGASPLRSAQPWIALGGLLVPFIILGIAIAVGYVPVG